MMVGMKTRVEILQSTRDAVAGLLPGLTSGRITHRDYPSGPDRTAEQIARLREQARLLDYMLVEARLDQTLLTR